ncbi:MAG TPA: hypothetical protein VF507_07755 [Pyrinomonadaceae bacterium]|jgi:hypothetical protein
MKFIFRVSLCLVATLAFALAAMGQDSNSKGGGAAKTKFKHNGKISTKYNKSKDQTAVELNPMAASSSMASEAQNLRDASQMDLAASFTYQGQVLTKPVEALTLTFHARAKNPVFQKGQNVLATLDGQNALMLGTSTYKSSSQTFIFEEIMSVQVPYETLSKIISAKTVELFLGPRKITLKESHIEALRDMASRMTP